MAEWIEINRRCVDYIHCRSPLAMAEWIEIISVPHCAMAVLSPLAMAEWIEINAVTLNSQSEYVSASDGGVD